MKEQKSERPATEQEIEQISDPEQVEKSYPSSEWTVQERLTVILAISDQMRKTDRPLVTKYDVQAWAQRIMLVLTASADYLEKEHNRAQILEGLSLDFLE